MKEFQILEEFKKMCEESLHPTLYSVLVERMIPALKSVRKELKIKSGMYGENPTIMIGRFLISEMQMPPGESVWIEDTEGDHPDAAELRKQDFEPLLKKFYDSHF